MWSRVLEQRSGRVIAISRLTLAAFFLVAVLVEPLEGHGRGGAVVALLALYTALATALILATWKDWWLECRLIVASHVADLAFFAAFLFLTGGYLSPFFGLFVFLVMAAAMRRGARDAIVTAAIVAAVFLLASWAGAVAAPEIEFDAVRFIVRAASIVVFSTMVLWFGINQFGATRARIGAQLLESVVSPEPPAPEALRFVQDRLGAARSMLIWSDVEEPWTHVLTCEKGEMSERRLGPEISIQLLERLPLDSVFLFDVARRKLLFEKGRLRAMRGDAEPFPQEFAAEHGIDVGLCIPLRTSRHEGLIVALDVAGLGADHLPIADKVGEVVANAFERASLLASMQEATAAKSRIALARDLHDGAVQFLAGMGLKVGALRRAVDSSGEFGQGLDDIAAELVRQQDEVRAMIDNLREPRRGRLELCDHLRALAKRIASQWGVAIEVVCRTTEIEVATHFRYQVDQIVREAVSNAARHGSARRVTATVMQDEGFLFLEIADDGSGFAFEGTLADAQLWAARSGPRSLHERVRSLGGTLAVASSPEGSRLYLKLPLRSDRT